MKKILLMISVFIIAIALSSCGGGSKGDSESSGSGNEKSDATQTIEFKDISLEIPEEWEFNEEASSKSYHTYTKKDGNEYSVWFQLTWTDIPVKLTENYTLEDAGKTLVGIYEKMDVNKKVSDSEQGFFAGEHGMNTVTCTEESDGETKYVKYMSAYFDDGTLKVTYKNSEEDYSAYNKAIKSAKFDGSSGGSKDSNADSSNSSGSVASKDSDPEPADSTTIKRAGASITIPGKWKSISNDSEKTKTYKNGDKIFLTYADTFSQQVQGSTLGDVAKGFLIGLGYKDMDYYDYTVGKDHEAHIIYVDSDKSMSKLDERYVIFGNGTRFIVFGYVGDKSGWNAIDKAMQEVTIS